MNRILRFTPLVLTAALAACSGGGSHVTPKATSSPGSGGGGGGGGNGSALALQSVPTGLTATVVNGGSSQNITTPGSYALTFSNNVTTVTFTPTNGLGPWVYSTELTNNPNTTVLYNAQADTAGSIGTISPLSLHSRVNPAKLRRPHAIRARNRGSAGRPAYSSTRLIVHYKLDALRALGKAPQDVEREVAAVRGVDLDHPSRDRVTRVIGVAPGDRIDALAARLRARPEVESVKPDALLYTQTKAAVSVNDPFFENYDQWYLFKSATPNGWGYTTGSPSVQVAIIDTGVDTSSPDLPASKFTFGEEIINGVRTPGIAAAVDTDGHGTNVTGLVGAVTDNSYGFASIGYNVGLQIYRVFPDGNAGNGYSANANESDITLAIQDAVANHAKVINLSLGTCNAQGIDSSLQDAVESAISSGVTVVAASGNERNGGGASPCDGNVSTVDFPAAFDGVIAVGASALNDNSNPQNYSTATEYVASYSNSGPGLSLVAPGGDPSNPSNNDNDNLHWIEGLYSTQALDPNNQCPDKSACFAVFAGTSQATPQVAAAAALLLSVNPNLTPAQIKQILIATADNINDPNQGGGRLNVYRALAAATGDPQPPSAPTQLNFVAFAYTPNGTNVPQILDVTYPHGVPVSQTGAFRIADIPSGAANYKIGVWYDANGDGKVDAGDYFGATATTCSATASCAAASSITVSPVPAGFVLQ